jgi:hypothetical protein
MARFRTLALVIIVLVAMFAVAYIIMDLLETTY